jgi:hypothetical protein
VAIDVVIPTGLSWSSRGNWQSTLAIKGLS